MSKSVNSAETQSVSAASSAALFSEQYPGIARVLQSCVQTTMNASMRHATQMPKTYVDTATRGTSLFARMAADAERMGGFHRLYFNGLGNRVQGQILSMGVANFTAEILKDHYPGISAAAKALIASGVETVAGAYKEVKANQPTYERATGVKMNHHARLAATFAAAPGFFVRNFSGWAAAYLGSSNNAHDKLSLLELFERAAVGVFAGIASSPADTFANFAATEAVKHPEKGFIDGAVKSVGDAFLRVANDPKDFFSRVARGAPWRGLGGAAGAVFFSKGFSDMVRDGGDKAIAMVNNFITEVYKEVGEVAKNPDTDKETVAMLKEILDEKQSRVREGGKVGIAVVTEENPRSVITRASAHRADQKTAMQQNQFDI